MSHIYDYELRNVTSLIRAVFANKIYFFYILFHFIKSYIKKLSDIESQAKQQTAQKILFTSFKINFH